ncbi:MAG: DUF2490 domain-containing protein [Gemmatimonadetes bacterium]|nr:DUF2490 domain-containing protein [Gemmatimonadota bacterium]
MHKQTCRAALVLALANGAGLRAQTSREDPVDVQSRFAAQVNLNLPSKWDASVGYEGRMIGNSSVYHGSYVSGELGHPLRKHLAVFANYRLARVAEEVSHRFGVGAELETKRGRLTISFRPMFQYQREFEDDDAEQGSRGVLRTRVRAKIPATKHVTVYGSVEPYFAFTGVFPVDNWRNSVGLQWDFMKHGKVDLHYIYRPDYAKFYNRTYHIVGVGFSMDVKLQIKHAKKKKARHLDR